jgi:glycosyltransferase involved in cell wall biosynthesis
MISIVIPLYDKATQVSATLSSVREQTFSSYEVVIVDDGSTDGSAEVVEEYLCAWPRFGARVRLLRQPHAGVSAARNKGITESSFDWIAFLDADDVWAPEYLERQYALSLKYPFCAVLAAAYGFSRGSGPYVPAKFSKLPFSGPDGLLDNYFVVASCSHPPLSSITTIVRKAAVLAVGGFPEGVSSGEDLLTWARLAIDNRIAFNRWVLGVYNQDPVDFNSDQRARKPASEDVVGSSLEALFQSHASLPGLKDYLGVWHKMRTRIYLTHSMRKEAWGEWRQLMRYHPFHYKTWAYLVLLVSPVKIL